MTHRFTSLQARFSRLKAGALQGAALLLGVICLGDGTALALTPELVVRFREPQNTEVQAALSALKMGVAPQTRVSVLNSEEGVVKLSFPSYDALASAQKLLAKADSVLNLTRNFMYQPAVRYGIEEVRRTQNTALSSLLQIPFLQGTVLPAALPGVELPGELVPGRDPLSAKDWVLENIRASYLKREASRDLITAVIDTGVDYNHEDLIHAMWRKDGDPYEVGYDFAQNTPRPFDVVHFDVEGCLKNFECRLGLDQSKFLVNPGHGTHCAGRVAAVANNSLGIRGTGAGAQVMALKFFYDVGHPNAGQGDDAAAIQSIDYAIKNGAKVISASWGARIPRQLAEKSELKQALVRAQKAGVLVVIAAGNDSVDQDKISDPSYPAAYDLDNLLVVAATNREDRLAEFSSYGAKSVHLAAPGVRILSTTSGNHYSDVVTRFRDADGKEQEVVWEGTSMATPIVAGAAALVWSKYPDEDYRQIRERLLKSVRKVPALAGKVATGGILDVSRALGGK